jgi:hypothetical protein
MPKLPDTYNKRPTPRFGVTPDRANPVVESGYSDLASGLDKLGQSFTALKIRDDKYRVKDAVTKTLERVLDIESGDQGYEHVKGADVFENDAKFMERQNSRFNEAVDEIQGMLKGSDQAAMFKGQVDVMRLQFQGSLVDHITKEHDAYQTETHNSSISVTQHLLAKKFNDPLALQGALDKIETEMFQEGERLGQDETTIIDNILKASSPALYSAISNAVGADDPEHAKDLLSAHKDRMSSEHIRAAEELIGEGDALKQAQSNLDSYIVSKMDVTRMREAARELEGEERAKTLKLIDDYHLDQKQQEGLGYEGASNEVHEYLNNGGSIKDAEILPALKRMHPKERYALEKEQAIRAKGESIKTHWPTYIELLYEAKADPERFKAERKLEKNLQHLETQHKNKIIGILTADPKVNDTLYGPGGLLDQAILGAGYEPGDLTDTDDDPDGDPEQARKFAREFMEELDKMGNWTEKDALDLAAQKAIKYRRETSLFPEWMQRTHRKLSKDDDPTLPWSVFGDDLIPAGRGDINDMPNDRIDDISKMLQDANIPVTERNIIFTYQQRKSRGLED